MTLIIALSNSVTYSMPKVLHFGLTFGSGLGNSDQKIAGFFLPTGVNGELRKSTMGSSREIRFSHFLEQFWGNGKLPRELDVQEELLEAKQVSAGWFLANPLGARERRSPCMSPDLVDRLISDNLAELRVVLRNVSADGSAGAVSRRRCRGHGEIVSGAPFSQKIAAPRRRGSCREFCRG